MQRNIHRKRLKAYLQVTVLLLVTVLLTAGCGDGNDGADVEAPGVSIKAGPDGAEIRAPGVNIKAGPDGAQVSAPGVDIKAGPEGAEVSAPGVNVQSGRDGVTIGVAGAESNDADSTAELSNEMQILARLVGHWNYEGAFKSTKSSTEGGELQGEFRGKTEYRWFMGRNFISVGPATIATTKTQQFRLFTFDSELESWRAWLFNSDGHSFQLRGEWNDETDTLTFTIDDDSDPPGLMMTFKFVDDKTVTETVVIRDADGAVIIEAESTATR